MGSASKILQYRYRFSKGLRPRTRCYTYKCNQTKHKLETATKKSFKSAYNITYSGSFILGKKNVTIIEQWKLDIIEILLKRRLVFIVFAFSL